MDKTIILAILGSGAFSALIGSITTYFIEKAKRKDTKNDMLILMCASELTMLGESAIKDGEISFAKAKLFKALYTKYKAIPEADGYVDLVNQTIGQLPLKEN